MTRRDRRLENVASVRAAELVGPGQRNQTTLDEKPVPPSTVLIQL